MTRSRPGLARVLNGLAVFFLVGGVACAFAPSARAATPGDGTDWGPGGSTGPTSSAVTVRWDNTAPGQPSYDQVPRNSSQILPYTGGKTYADADPAVSAATKQQFGNLSVTVDQTQNLTYQNVGVSFTGTTGYASNVDVFQCRASGPTVDGVAADEPDPTRCETLDRGIDDLDDAGLIAGGDLPSPLAVVVSGYEDPGGTSAHLWAQVATGAGTGGTGLSPAEGTVQFATTAGKKLGTPAPVVKGVAEEDVPGLVKGASTNITATFTPARGQNYVPAVPSAPLSLPETYTPGSGENVNGLSDNSNNVGENFYPGSLFSAAALAGTFKAGDKVNVTVNAETGITENHEYGLIIPVPVPGAVVHSFGTVTAASDGSATITAAVPSLPASEVPTGTDLVFTDAKNPKDSVAYFASVYGFQPPQPAQSTSANQPPDDQTTTVPWEDAQGDPQGEVPSDFNTDTTNEAVWDMPSSASAVTTRQFTTTTTVQDPSLGCGAEAGTPSTATCWLVIVPLSTSSLNQQVLSPSVWAQRLQVKLGFAPISTSCAASTQSVSGVGSELLAGAMSSWVPAICAKDKVDVQYASLGDSIARQEYEDGSTSLIFTSKPVGDAAESKTLYAPVGLSGVTIGLHLPETDGGQATSVKLDARLVAKLLTQSYISGIDPGAADALDGTGEDKTPYQQFGSHAGPGVPTFAPWALTTEFPDLFADPEFKALNPRLSYSTPLEYDNFDNLGSLVVSSTASDPIGVLWQWILSDPEARAFLDGCPDTASEIGGHPTVVNPFFSTETYAQCPQQKKALQKTASAQISQTISRFRAYASAAKADLAQVVPVPQAFSYTYTYTPAVYSASSPQFPLPAWYTVPTNGYGFQYTPQDPTADIFQEETSLASVGTDIALGAPPWVADWCQVVNGGGNCTAAIPYGADGAWQKETKGYLNPVMGITDAPATSQFQTVTAQLCDDGGHCAGADTQSLEAAAAHFTKTSAPGVLAPSMTPDEAGGAYPLTVPVYAAVNTSGLPDADAAGYADLLEYVSGAGNQPGLAPGSLPPGYAPLPSGWLARDAAAVTELDKIAKTPPGSSTGPNPAGSASRPAATSAAAAAVPGQAGSTARTPSSSPRASSPLASPGARASAEPAAFRSVTGSTPVGFLAEYGLIAGLVLALACAGGSLLAGRGRRLDFLGGLAAAGRLGGLRGRTGGGGREGSGQ
jgi:hypothetical protein